ncbi:MAG: PilZ domain-containing protein [Deltaproteobacteria bacterium]|nr:PilZ domain-containing protein [Deltaproteobacteria bacterium]
MSQSVSVLLLDDGELDDVQTLLERMRIPFGRVRGASIVPGMPGPSHLLISTPRRIEAVTSVRDDRLEGNEPVRIMVTSEDSNALRTQLRNVGFDYLVRRPVHPEALRLLILHAMYTGEEQRREPRVAVGFDVTFKSGLIPRQGTLADLSMRGCRLLANRRLELGKRVKIQIPEALGASEVLSLRGRVIRAVFDKDLGESGLYSLAVLFEKTSSDERRELEWIIEERSKGPPRTDEGQERGDPVDAVRGDRGIREIPARNIRNDPRFEADELQLPTVDVQLDPPEEDEKPLESMSVSHTAEPAEAVAVANAAAEEEDTLSTAMLPAEFVEPAGGNSDRRRSERATFDAKVPAFGSSALRVLVGRDLSIGGMRVEANSNISIGDRLHLAIYGTPDDEPLLIWATVDRDDGEQGLELTFDELHEVIQNRLERIVVSLPSVESLRDGELDAMGTVMSEMLPTKEA